LRAGDGVHFGVNASFSDGDIEEARFRINNGDWMVTSEQKTVGGDSFYYISFYIPEGSDHFKIESEVYHSVLGWL